MDRVKKQKYAMRRHILFADIEAAIKEMNIHIFKKSWRDVASEYGLICKALGRKNNRNNRLRIRDILKKRIQQTGECKTEETHKETINKLTTPIKTEHKNEKNKCGVTDIRYDTEEDDEDEKDIGIEEIECKTEETHKETINKLATPIKTEHKNEKNKYRVTVIRYDTEKEEEDEKDIRIEEIDSTDQQPEEQVNGLELPDLSKAERPAKNSEYSGIKYDWIDSEEDSEGDNDDTVIKGSTGEPPDGQIKRPDIPDNAKTERLVNYSEYCGIKYISIDNEESSEDNDGHTVKKDQLKEDSSSSPFKFTDEPSADQVIISDTTNLSRLQNKSKEYEEADNKRSECDEKNEEEKYPSEEKGKSEMGFAFLQNCLRLTPSMTPTVFDVELMIYKVRV